MSDTVNEFITRQEYEARNAQTHAEISKLDAKLDALSSKIELLSVNMNSQMSNIKTSSWKYIATSLLSFMGGGGALGLIEFLLTRR